MRSISVDVDIDDIIWGMGKYDRKAFFQAMQDEGGGVRWIFLLLMRGPGQADGVDSSGIQLFRGIITY
jgi:hypothetical protein